MDETLAKLDEIRWRWATQDLLAQQEMERRIIERARRQSLSTYSDLVEGVDFDVPSMIDGVPFRIDVHH